MFQLRFIACLALTVGGAFAEVSQAAEYPEKPIRLVVPYAPGGNADIMARTVGERLGRSLGRQVVIDNRPGANSIIGTEAVANAAPVSEAGLPGYQASIWNGILAPAATPNAIVAKLNGEIVRVLNASDTRERFAGIGADIAGSSPEVFRAFIESELTKWSKVIRESGIKVDLER